MKKLLAEKNIAAMLFVMVVVIFSFAQKESKKIEYLYINASVSPHYTPVAFAEVSRVLSAADSSYE